VDGWTSNIKHFQSFNYFPSSGRFLVAHRTGAFYIKHKPKQIFKKSVAKTEGIRATEIRNVYWFTVR
jgi:hypothetical protein